MMCANGGLNVGRITLESPLVSIAAAKMSVFGSNLQEDPQQGKHGNLGVKGVVEGIAVIERVELLLF